MQLGTKSLLFGVHQFAVHPLFVLLAWCKLFGFPWDPRIWLAILVHDWGYWGTSMAGAEDLHHPRRGARIMRAFGDPWYLFCLLHSRAMARSLEAPVSRLALADKLSLVLTPAPLWLLCARLSGEVTLFMGGRQNLGKTAPAWLGAARRENLAWVIRKTLRNLEFQLDNIAKPV